MTLRIESDARLAHDVGAGAGDLILNGVSGMGSQVAPYMLPPGPLEFLLAAGRATAAIFSPTRALFETTSHWAIVRWWWAFDWSRTEVSLSPFAGQIRNHHRTAFSESLGLAAGLLVVEHIAGDTLPGGASRGGPILVDIDSLVPSGKRPDLLILFGSPGLQTYVLEAKGNSSGRAYSVTQLRSGIEQVLAAPGSAERLVVSASASNAVVDVQAIRVPTRNTTSPRLSTVDADDRRALPMEQQRLASFAGVPSPESDGTVHEIPQLEVDVIGRQFTLLGDGLTAEVTIGVDRRVYDRLLQVTSISELSEMRSQYSRDVPRWFDLEQAAAPLTEVGRAATIARDGCALSVSLT